jgi:hypothetical protein
MPDFALVKTQGKISGVLDQANGILYKTHADPDILQPVDQVTYLSAADLAKVGEVVPNWPSSGDLLQAALEPEKHPVAGAKNPMVLTLTDKFDAKDLAGEKALDYRVYAHLMLQLLHRAEPYYRDHKSPPAELNRTLVLLRDTVVPNLQMNFNEVVASNSSYFDKYDVQMLPTELGELLTEKWEEASRFGYKP